MIRIHSEPNEAHQAAALVSNAKPMTKAQKRARLYRKVHVCSNPNCVKARKRFNAYRTATSVTMLAATGAGVASYLAGYYVLTVLSPILGFVSHSIDTWLIEGSDHDKQDDVILEDVLEGTDNA